MSLPTHWFDLSAHGLRLILARTPNSFHLVMVGVVTSGHLAAAKRLWMSEVPERPDVLRKVLLTERDGAIRSDSLPSRDAVLAIFPEAVQKPFSDIGDLVDLGPVGIAALPRHEPRETASVPTWQDHADEAAEVLLTGRATFQGVVHDVVVRLSGGYHEVLYGNELQSVVSARSPDLRTAMMTFTEVASTGPVRGWRGTSDPVDPRIGEGGVPVLNLEVGDFVVGIVTSRRAYVVEVSSDMGRTVVGRSADLERIVRTVARISSGAPGNVARLPRLLVEANCAP